MSIVSQRVLGSMLLASACVATGCGPIEPPPPRPRQGGVSSFDITDGPEGRRGSVIVDGKLMTAGPLPPDEFWAAVGLTGSPLPQLQCRLPELDVEGMPARPIEGYPARPREGGTGETGGEHAPGEGGLPPDYFPADNEKYPGSQGGGCGTFATLQCLDILDKVSRPITRERWKEVHDGIGENASGGSNGPGRAEYYLRLGYCVKTKTLVQADNDLAEIARLKGEGCDCTVSMIGPRFGHVEVITGVVTRGGQTCLKTNSWGSPAEVCGHDKDHGNAFSHSQDVTGGNFDPGGNWPAGRTSAYWQCICRQGTPGTGC